MREIRKTGVPRTFIFLEFIPYIFMFLGKEEKQPFTHPTQTLLPAVPVTIWGVKRLLQAHSQVQVKNLGLYDH